MNEMSIVGGILAVALPWACGYSVFRTLCGPTLIRSAQLAHGYLLGLLITTLVFRLFDAAGIAFTFWGISLCLLFVAAAAVLLQTLLPKQAVPLHTTGSSPRIHETPGNWAMVVIALLLLLIAVRIALATYETVLRPLFPWDAWNAWAPLTIQYYEAGSLTAEFQTRASAHGKTASIIHLWGMLAGDTTSHPLTRLPWLFAWLALALALFGHIKMYTCNTLAAIMGAYLCVSLPYLYIHTALSGYADLWLTLAFTLGVLTLGSYPTLAKPALFTLTVIYALACISLKESGILMGGTLLLLLILRLFFKPLWIRRSLFAATAAALTVIVFLSFAQQPLNLDIPLLGTLTVSSNVLTIPGLSNPLQLHWIVRPLSESLLLFSQLHLLTYFTCATLLLVVIYKRWHLLNASSFLAIMLGGTLVMVYFSFADFAGAAQHTGLTRALMPLMPAAIYWCVVCWAQASRNRWTLHDT